MPTAGVLIVVCQCHRSCRYVEVASFHGVLPQVQFLDKVVDMPVASMTGAWGSSVQKTAASAVAVLTLGSMSLLCRSSIGSLLEVLLKFSSSPEFVDLPACTETGGLSVRVWRAM